MRVRKRYSAAPIAVAVSLTAGLLALSPAQAASGHATWTSYLYQGPGSRYSVVDEVQQAQPFSIGKCADAWCEVSYDGRFGYVRQEIVARDDTAHPAEGVLPQPAASITPKPKGPCYKVDITGGNGGNAPTWFCDK